MMAGVETGNVMDTSVEMKTSGAKAGAAFEPRIVAFLCKWCTYAGADLAGTSRMTYPANVRALMLPCTGRIDVSFVLRAFLQGADGVLVSGCHPGDCHYTAGNYRARRRWILFRDLLDVIGFDLRRFDLAWISAAEGAKFVKTIQTFTDKIKGLGPYEAMHKVAQNHTPAAVPDAIQEVLKGNGHQHELKPASPELIAAATEALKSGKVKAIVGWAKNWTLLKPRPIWIIDAAEAPALLQPADHPANLARFLKNSQLRAFSPVGIVARRSEMMALNVLLQEEHVDPASIVVLAIGEDGKFLGTMDLDGGSKALVTPMAGCLPANRVAGFSEETLKQLDELMARTPDERWAFWSAQFSGCIKCYACRGSCPLCTCEQCFADRNQPQWFPTAADGPGNLAWHIMRAFHLAGRCVGCGACQEACPAGIPLNILGAALARSALKNFEHRAGVDPKAVPLQSDFRSNDKENFIL